MKAIKKLDEFLNESISNDLVDYNKLVEYAKAIGVLCNGEYGTVYYNAKQNHVFVCLGDSNPFDDGMLESYMRDAIATDWHTQDKIKITIENECGPRTDEEGWVEIN